VNVPLCTAWAVLVTPPFGRGFRFFSPQKHCSPRPRVLPVKRFRFIFALAYSSPDLSLSPPSHFVAMNMPFPFAPVISHKVTPIFPPPPVLGRFAQFVYQSNLFFPFFLPFVFSPGSPQTSCLTTAPGLTVLICCQFVYFSTPQPFFFAPFSSPGPFPDG